MSEPAADPKETRLGLRRLQLHEPLGNFHSSEEAVGRPSARGWERLTEDRDSCGYSLQLPRLRATARCLTRIDSPDLSLPCRRWGSTSLGMQRDVGRERCGASLYSSRAEASRVVRIASSRGESASWGQSFRAWHSSAMGPRSKPSVGDPTTLAEETQLAARRIVSARRMD